MKIVGVNHEFFNEFFTSHDLGTCKPSKKAFSAPLKKFRVKPKEPLFIGDACDELKGAKKIGLVTIGFKCGCGDYNIKNLDEILRILQKLNQPRNFTSAQTVCLTCQKHSSNQQNWCITIVNYGASQRKVFGWLRQVID